ncbi:MAG: pyridoxal-5'-phosphate-dependent protein subunit beta [Myxococcales bacterium]|nr:pyridoxal-5'-phosphate-dependent protein subunit beta [Myxococcales bacterium]
MSQLGLEQYVVNPEVLAHTIAHFREQGIILPTFAQLADPSTIPDAVTERLADVSPDAADPLNLFRVHWYNSADRASTVDVPGHVVLPPSLTGVQAPIVVALGERFPMIAAHKVLAAYGCLAPRLVTGQFDPTAHKAIWPSTGNYCRGGIAVSRIMNCRGVAILPEGMSRERFDWLDAWCLNPADDIVRTPGSESNVKEIYDACNELDLVESNVIFNQFAEFGNALVHRFCTGAALSHIYRHVAASREGLELFAFTSATGSAGTLSAGDHLKDAHGTRIVAVEATACPTLLRNGFGEHNIQGIGDKHVPYVHNVMNTDAVAGIDDAASDSLYYLCKQAEGRKYLAERHGVPQEILEATSSFGLSSWANILAAIKVAKYWDLGPNQAIMTVATDGAAMYGSEDEKILRTRFGGQFDQVAAAEAFGRHMLGNGTDWFDELSYNDKQRMFNLGYYTWVEQQGVSVEEFSSRKNPAFWRDLDALVPAWDAMIADFNAQTGLL